MRLVLEGPDGAGKTTLAETLRAATGWTYQHEGPPPASASADDTGLTMVAYYGATLRENGGVLHDRWALGERVYGPLFRGRDVLGDEGWRLLARALAIRGGRVVVCLPPLDVVVANWRAKTNDLTAQIGDLRAAWFRFNDFARDYGLAIYDYTRDDSRVVFARELKGCHVDAALR